MPREIIMPKVDMDMAQGTILAWHVTEGAAVTRGQLLFEIETDKAAMEIEADADGILHHRAPEGATVRIGAPVGWLYDPEEEVGAAPSEAPPEDEPADTPTAPAPPAPQEPQGAGGLRASPKARALARESGLALDKVAGTGPRGRVQGTDVAAALGAVRPVTTPVGFKAATGPLNVTRVEGAGPPLVMIHGFASDAASWAPLERELRGRARIRIDLPCHGKSPLMQVQSFAELVQHARRALDALALERFDLLGHSLGGAVALALADTRPRKVQQLTLLAPAGLGAEIDGDAIGGLTRATRAESLAPWLRRLVTDDALITEGYLSQAMASRAQADLRAAQHAMAEALFPDGVQAFDLRAALHRVEQPTRIIWGKRDSMIPWRHAFTAPGRVALHLFEGVGHLPQVEMPQELGKLLSKQV